jgi:RHS repeat-associated protein
VTPARFKCDPLGRRIYKSSSSGTSVFAYDGDNLVEETNATGAVVARYSQTQNIDEPLAMLRSAATRYFHADGLGSVTSLSNAAGSIANTYTYDSFGKLTASTGSLVNPFRYTARESDTETGLYYYRARYYDPTTGRFPSEDPAGFSSDSLNFYGYVSNNPLVFSDPSGLKKIHGNWCGPNWTGGKKEPFIPSNDTPGYYAPPIDYVDIPCSNHDKCYSKCRDKHPCSPWGRRACERKCDFSLVGGILGHPFNRVKRDDGSLSLPNILNPWAPIIGLGMALDFVPPAGPNGGADPYSNPAEVKCCSNPPPAGAGAR